MATRAEREPQRERRARILATVLSHDEVWFRRQAGRCVRYPEDAEDALQDACLEFLRHYEGPPGERAARYLTVSVRRRARVLGACAWRRHHAACVEVATTDAIERGEPRIAVISQGPGPAERLERAEEVVDFAEALAGLKPDERTALLLHGLGCSYREIAERRGWTQTKVNRCLAEGRSALRQALAGGEPNR